MKRVSVLLVLIILMGTMFSRGQNRTFEDRYTYLHLLAPALMIAEEMKDGEPSPKFAGSVGGVSFDQIAQPASGLNIQQLSLQYDSSRADGSRLHLNLNDKKVQVALADWLLVPIAHYANSDYYSCFTLFGHLKNKEKAEDVLSVEGRIMNYHPAFVNTLLGYRLFYLDILILYPHAVTLPVDKDGQPWLGLGEKIPPAEKSKRALYAFDAVFRELQNQYGVEHRSWIISDYSRHIRFDVADDSLLFYGYADTTAGSISHEDSELTKVNVSPYYFFWRYESDRPDYDAQEMERRIRTQLQEEATKAVDRRAWVFDTTLRALRKYQEEYEPAFGGAIEELVELPLDSDRLAYLDEYDHTSIFEHLLVPLLLYMEEHQIDHLAEFSEAVSARPDLLRPINPNVWDAAVRTMKFAAFFRYCKQEFPEDWQTFMEQLEDQGIELQPAVQTPTVMIPKQ